MLKNVGNIDKIVRIIMAVIAGYFAYKIDFVSVWKESVLWAFSIIMLFTTALGTCPVYSLIKSKIKNH